SEPNKEVARIASAIDLEFPASDVLEVTPGKNKETPPGVVINFLGLAGALGPLPKPYTEMVLERARDKDFALKDFLDIFNNRLVSLLYRSRKGHRLTLGHKAPGEDILCGFLYSVVGLGADNLREQIQGEERAILRYAGLLGHQPRSLIGLELLLSDYFQVPVKGTQLCGQWCPLDRDQQTAIGLNGRNQRLGVDTVVVGKRIWDQNGKFELSVGPLTFKQFINLLPLGRGFTPLCDLTRFYVGDQHDFSFNLKLKSSEVPAAILSRNSGPRLSWTVWLRTKASTQSEVHVTISPKSMDVFPLAFSIPAFASLPLVELTELTEKMSTLAFKPNTIIFRQDEPVDSLYIIHKGSVRLSQRDASGKDQTVTTLKIRDFFGDISPISEKTRTSNFTIVSTRVCEILRLNRNDLIDVLTRYPRVRNALRRHYINSLSATEAQKPKAMASGVGI